MPIENPDPRHIYRAMETAGLDPANPAHVEYFTRLVMDRVAAIPEGQRQNFTRQTWERVLDQAADAADNAQILPMLKDLGLSNDPSHLWELTEHGKVGRARRERNHRPDPVPTQPTSPDRGDNFTPEGQRTVRDTFTQDSQPRQPDKFKPREDLNDLWKQAREQGLI